MVGTLGDRKRLYVFHRLGKVVYLAQSMDTPFTPHPSAPLMEAALALAVSLALLGTLSG